MALTYTQRLRSSHSLLCLGLDPVPEKIAACLGRADVGAAEEFLTAILDEVVESGRLPGCLKPNLAYFEQFGSAGLALLERLVEGWDKRTPVVFDAKRGDIGHSSRAYARAVFDTWDADAVTISPWMGWDSMEPFLDYCPERGVYVLLRTSNPGAADLQDGVWEGLAENLAARYRDGLGAVVGATRPQDLARVVQLPAPLSLLIPGVGTQGGSAGAVVSRLGSDSWRHRVNVSSAILYSQPDDRPWRHRVADAYRHYWEALASAPQPHSGQ